uniref:Gag-pol polyprotein n=1 Tax=Solanum tuberosum TaxID=4113 RepID=M1DHU4_SOLTU
MVADMRSWMSLFLVGLTRLSSNESKAAMLIGDMGIARLMIHVQQVEEGKLKDSEEFNNKKANTSGSMAQGRTKILACAKCGRNHSGMCCDDSIRCFKCGQNGYFMRECPKSRIVMVMRAIEPSLLQLLHQIELHLDELLQGQAEKETVFMLSLVAERKRIRHMLSLVSSKSSVLNVLPEKIFEPSVYLHLMVSLF